MKRPVDWLGSASGVGEDRGVLLAMPNRDAGGRVIDCEGEWERAQLKARLGMSLSIAFAEGGSD